MALGEPYTALASWVLGGGNEGAGPRHSPAVLGWARK